MVVTTLGPRKLSGRFPEVSPEDMLWAMLQAMLGLALVRSKNQKTANRSETIIPLLNFLLQ